jgi:hypothetical protein
MMLRRKGVGKEGWSKIYRAIAMEFPPGFLSGREQRSMRVSWIVSSLGWTVR